jgi:hypothetical protein
MPAENLLKRAKERVRERLRDAFERLIARGIAAIPFLIALGFATAALAIKAIELWGAAIGCLVVAALYLVAATVLAAFFIGKEERENEEREPGAEQVSSLLNPFQSNPVAPSANVLRTLGRSSPLLLVLVAGICLWAYSQTASEARHA